MKGQKGLGLAVLAIVLSLVPILSVLGIVLFFGRSTTSAAATSCSAASTSTSGPAPLGIPRDLYPIYLAASGIYGVPWQYLAAINKIESNFGQSTLPGVHSGSNFAGAAGPMQFGIGGAAGNTWGGAPRHRVQDHNGGYASDGDNDGWEDVYNPADAIFAAAKYLKANGAPSDMYRAIFAYNHADWYVREVSALATQYVKNAGNQPAPTTTLDTACSVGDPPAASPEKIKLFVQAAYTQLGKDYVWGGDCTGTSGCDCSGLVWWAAQQAGFHFGRTTAADQYNLGQYVDRDQLQYGDLIFWGDGSSDSSRIHHVAIYLGPDKSGTIQMIAAPRAGTVVRIQPVYWENYYGATRLAG